MDTTPALGSDGALYFGAKGKGGSGGVFYAIEPNGTERWNYPVGGVVRSSAVIGGNGTIYVGGGSSLLALNPTGTLAWSYDLGRPLTSSPVIGADGSLYIGCKGVFAFGP